MSICLRHYSCQSSHVRRQGLSNELQGRANRRKQRMTQFKDKGASKPQFAKAGQAAQDPGQFGMLATWDWAKTIEVDGSIHTDSSSSRAQGLLTQLA